ncbi:tetratricopeptide repeat protein [Micromonospora sp. NPDC049101]|uniref:tetratricopeptide repeat protein n=1 Tax=Micromonospora sp. NPDC049101 TaxID=3155032 RepID=UPI003404A011
MGARRSRDRRIILAVAGLALLTATPASLVAANVTNLWIVAGVTAIAAVAAALGAIWQGRAQRYGQRRDDQQLGVVDGCLVLRGRLPRVRDVGRPTWLGVNPAVAAADTSAPERLPPYVPRDIDAELRRQLTGSVFVLLVGDSLAGKSRAAYEAIRDLLPNHVLVAPSTRDAIPHAVVAAAGKRRSVLWLDDIEQFLGPGGLTRAGVATVLGAGRGHRVIIATLRAVEAERLDPDRVAADDGQRQAHKEARSALAQAHRIRVERQFTRAERTRARGMAGDRRIGDALAVADDYGVAEYLGAGPDLLSAWENAWSPNQDPHVPSHPRGAALVAAAVDVRCAGYPSPIPRAVLELLHHRYLDDRGGERLRPETVAEAWNWATQARRVTTALLQPAADERIKVFDYLVDAVQRGRPPDQHVPEPVIREVLSISSATEADSIAAVAQQQGRPHLARLAWLVAYEQRVEQLGRTHADTIAAHGRLASAVRDLGHRAEAEALYRAALADSTETLGVTHPQTLLLRGNLSILLVDAGEYRKAEGELRDVLTVCLETLGPAHPHTLQLRASLALVLLATHRAGDAAAELTEVVSVRTRLNGPDHPDTLSARHHLAGAHATLGHQAQAETGYREVLTARARVLGPNHPATLGTREALGLLLEPVPSFNVVLLGTQGAGKSVLLASMFTHLRRDAAIDGVRVRGDMATTIQLTSLYQDVVDRDGWPPGTAIADRKVFSFGVLARHEHAEKPMLTINFLDYAGSLLESREPGDPAVAELATAVASADALFGVLDGLRLRRCLRGEPVGELYLDSIVDPLLSVMASAKVPAHLLITKWDVFGGTEGSSDREVLRRIRDLLMRRPHFQDVVRGQPVRLIPVSAVGRGFTTVDDDGMVHKRAGGQPAPFNVEIPFCTVVPDLFDRIGRNLESALREATDRGPRWDWRMASRLRQGILAYVVARAALRRRDSRWDDLGPMLDDELAATDGSRARQALLHRLRSVIAAFEAQFPEAMVTRSGSDDPTRTERR